MYGLLNEAGTLSPAGWEQRDLDQIVAALKAEFPTKSAAEVEQAVQFCKGAVRRYQGCAALEEFAGALLRSVDLHRASHGGREEPH